MKKAPLFLLFFLFTLNHYSQQSGKGKPLMGHSHEVPFLQMPPVNNETLQKRTEACTSCKKMTFAHPFEIKINPSNYGITDTINDHLIRRLGINSPKAHSLNLIFEEFHLAPQTRLYIYDPAQKQVLGAYTYRNNTKTGIFPTTPIENDSVIVEIIHPLNNKKQTYPKIKQISHGFRAIGSQQQFKDSRYGLSDWCEKDINCPAGNDWQKEKRAVVRIFFDGSTFCTGTLLNNTAGDETPYVLTASHCIDNETSANQSIFYFNYESAACDGLDGLTYMSISGSSLKATSSNVDFTLLELDKQPTFAFLPYYAGWDHDINAPSYAASIHHPQGDVKKISIENQAPVTGTFNENGYDINSFWKIQEWDIGTTEKGSSGSPLFNQNKQVVGNLTGGRASCSDPTNDYYTKFSRAWDDYSGSGNQLKYWLDPLNTGSVSINGFDPVEQNCDSLSNFASTDNTYTYEFSQPGWGYINSQNSDSATCFADQMILTGNNYAYGMYINIFKADYESYLYSEVNFKLWSGDSIPDTIITEKKFKIHDLPEQKEFFVPFDSAITLPDTFFAGYEVYYGRNDTFATTIAEDRTDSTLNTAYVKKDGQWLSFDDAYGISTSLNISLQTCNILKKFKLNTKIDTPRKISAKENDQFTIYPNPVDNKLKIHLPNKAAFKRNVSITINNITGKQLYASSQKRLPEFTIPVNHLPKGLYVIQIKTDHEHFTNKFIKK